MNYVITHLHSNFSLIDSTTPFKAFIDKAKEEGMKAIAFTEHGNIYKWVEKKMYCDKVGIKYIHGMEAYLTQGLEFGKLRDNYHIVLLAKNYQGVQEINELFSRSYEADRFYHKPRITFEDFYNISDNIITTSACLGGPLWQIMNTIKELKNNIIKEEKILYDLNAQRNRLIISTKTQQKQLDTVDKKISESKKKIENYKANIDYLKNNYIPLLQKFDYLEIQPHVKLEDQIKYNKMLYKYAKKYNKLLVAGTDTHSLNQYMAECRALLIEDKYKNGKVDITAYEEECDLTFKTYDELVEMFKQQQALPSSVYLDAIENTNRIADMIEDFTLDKSFKYPDIPGVDDIGEALKQRINECFKDKKDEGIIDATKSKEYLAKLREEFRVFDKIGMHGFILGMSNLIKWCRENGIPTSPCRGSVGGSEIAYMSDIIDVDPVKRGTIFSRFANEDRIELGDIDIDISPDQRDLVYKHIIESYAPTQTAFILSFGTQKALGTIDSLGRTYNLPLEEVKALKEQFKANSNNLKEKYQDLFEDDKESLGFGTTSELEYIKKLGTKKDYTEKQIKEIIKFHIKQTKELRDKYPKFVKYYNGLFGCPVSQSMHPAGIIIAPSYVNLPRDYGVFESDGKKVIAIDMDECHDVSLVKYDILGLKQVQIDRIACENAGIRMPLAHEIDWDDEIVWKHMMDSPIGLFQFEGNYAFRLLKNFKPHHIDDMTLVNAALRPSGKSYRDDLLAGKINKNPSKQIDDLLAKNHGYLVYQEDTIKFLQEICGLSGSDADNIRRAIGHKDREKLEKAMPDILTGYCNKSEKEKNVAENEAKTFLKIIEDSASYQFGYNHATGYSMEGYRGIYLRTYFPAEFIVGYLNSAKGIEDIQKGDSLAHSLDISYLNEPDVKKRKAEIINSLSNKKISIDDLPIYPNKIKIYPPTFGKSRGEYSVDSETYAIYKGIGSIKGLNKNLADELFYISNNDKYQNIEKLNEYKKLALFYDLIQDIKANTSLNKKQLEILIKLNYFRMFGKNQTLYSIQQNVLNITKRSQYNKNELEFIDVNSDIFLKYVGNETKSLYKKIDYNGYYHDWVKTLKNEAFPIKKQLEYENEYVGSFILQIDSKNPYYYILDMKTYNNPNKPYAHLYNLTTGDILYGKVINGEYYALNKFQEKSVLSNLVFHEITKKKKLPDGTMIDSDEKIAVFDKWNLVDF